LLIIPTFFVWVFAVFSFHFEPSKGKAGYFLSSKDHSSKDCSSKIRCNKQITLLLFCPYLSLSSSSSLSQIRIQTPYCRQYRFLSCILKCRQVKSSQWENLMIPTTENLIPLPSILLIPDTHHRYSKLSKCWSKMIKVVSIKRFDLSGFSTIRLF